MTTNNIRQASQKALLGVITKQTMGVCIDWEAQKLIMTVYLEEQPTEEEFDQFASAAELTLAGIFPDLQYEELIIVEKSTFPLATRGLWVFLRSGCITSK